VLVAHLRLVHWVVRRQWLGALPYGEALQVGRIALWQAAQYYDPRRGTAFSTYAVAAIRHAIWRAVAAAQPRPPAALGGQAPAGSDLVASVERRLLGEAVRHLVAQLPPRLAQVIVARYGLADGWPQTFAEIGRGLGVTRQRAQQLHAEALLWLAQPAHSLALRHWLDRNTTADYRAFLAQQRRWLRRRRSP
jgi:RNA polymerase sigma factor (sigma-70 family)